MLIESIQGKRADELKSLDKNHIFEMLGIEIGPVRVKCALLSLKALKAAVYSYLGQSLTPRRSLKNKAYAQLLQLILVETHQRPGPWLHNPDGGGAKASGHDGCTAPEEDKSAAAGLLGLSRCTPQPFRPLPWMHVFSG